jgi:hypothetical protein
MGNFIGGSAYAMAHQIAEGFVIVTERTFVRLLRPELDQLSFELERLTRDVRGEQPALEDLPAIQLRNRKLQRLNSAAMMLSSFRQRRRV